MSKLTRTQIKQIQNIIKEHMEVLMKLTIGDGDPSPRLVKKLKLPKKITDLITSSYQYGKLRVLEGKDLSKLTSDELQKLLNSVALTKSQKKSMEFSRLKAQQHIDTLSQKITSFAVSSAIQSDLAMWQAVKEVIPSAIENDTPRYKVIQQLREKTGDWERDWHRVAHTEMWSAKCQGEVDAILSGESPLSGDKEDTEVYCKPASRNACAKCRQLYLEKDGITPKVFKLSQLLANGNNYGKKQADWLPCVPPLHPNCMCTINVKPKNTKFNQQGNLELDL